MKTDARDLRTEHTPDDVTDAFLGRCWDAFHADPDNAGFRAVTFARVWAAGTWLDAQLRAGLASDDACARVCFAHGQMSLGHDPWSVARRLARQWRDDPASIPQPGPELAASLIAADPVGQLRASLEALLGR